MALRPPDTPENKKSPIDHRYDQELNPLDRSRQKNTDTPQGLKNEEERAGKASGGSGDSKNIYEKEQQGGWNVGVTPRGNATSGPPRTFKGILTGAKKRGPLMSIIVTVLFGLGIGGSFFGATIAPLMAVHNITDDLNDQLSSVERRMDKLLMKKFSKISPNESVSFGCTGVGSKLPIKCKYKTISKSFKEKLSAKGIEVEGESGGVFGNRTKPTHYKFQGKTYTAEEFTRALKTDRALAMKYRQAVNMKFLSLKGKTYVKNTLAKFGLSEADPGLRGTHEERVNQLMNRANATDIGDLHFTAVVDEDGNITGYTLDGDSSGKIYTEAEMKKSLDSIDRIKATTEPPSHMKTGTLHKVGVGLNILGALDTACTVKNMVGAAAVASKVLNAAELAKYALPFATLAGEMKAGNIKPEDAQVLQEFFNDTDAQKTIASFVEGTDDEPAVEETPNPNYGKNAMDSELYKMSAGGGVAYTTTSEKMYSLGFGVSSMVYGASAIARFTDKILNFGPFNNCDLVQSWWGRGAGIVIGVGLIIGGIIGSIGTGGALAPVVIGGAASVAKNLAVMTAAMVLVNYILNAALSGSIISTTMSEMPVERGAAFWTGMAVILGQTAQYRGMMPGNAKQIVAYQSEQNIVKQDYLAYERKMSNPLDITNPHSLTGTIALAIHSQLPNKLTGSNLYSLPASMSSFVLKGFSSILSPYSTYATSLDESRFKQCDDVGYKDIGIEADVQCNIRYVMPESSMELDPIDVAEYMETNGYVEEDTTTGLPKGYSIPQPEETKNLATQLVKGMVDTVYNTRSYGDTEAGKEYGKFLDFCVYRVLPFGETYEENGSFGDAGHDWKSGKNCLKEEEPYNYFRMYTFDQTVNDDMDESPVDVGGSRNGDVLNTDNWPTADVINARIEKSEAVNGRTSPLHGMGEQFITFGKTYGINPGIVAAILQRESQLGTDDSVFTREQANNFGGITGDGPCGYVEANGRHFKKFCDATQGLEANFALFTLSVYTSTDGSMDQIMEVYAPKYENDWDDMWNIFHAVAQDLNISIEPTTNIYSNPPATNQSAYHPLAKIAFVPTIGAA